MVSTNSTSIFTTWKSGEVVEEVCILIHFKLPISSSLSLTALSLGCDTGCRHHYFDDWWRRRQFLKAYLCFGHTVNPVARKPAKFDSCHRCGLAPPAMGRGTPVPTETSKIKPNGLSSLNRGRSRPNSMLNKQSSSQFNQASALSLATSTMTALHWRSQCPSPKDQRCFPLIRPSSLAQMQWTSLDESSQTTRVPPQ